MTDSLKLIMTPEDIHAVVRRVAGEIKKDYESTSTGQCAPPVFVGILKGALVFLSDLIRMVDIPVEVDYLQTSSYGLRSDPSPEAMITQDITTHIQGRDVIVVEDIVDRGVTARAIMDHLQAKKPASVKLCALLVRTGAHIVKIDYAGRPLDDGFVVGYGMDYKERHRNLPGLHILTRGD